MAPSETAAASSGLLTAPLDSAITLTKKFGLYFVAIAGTLTALLTLWDKFGLWKTYGALGIAAFITVIIAPLAAWSPKYEGLEIYKKQGLQQALPYNTPSFLPEGRFYLKIIFFITKLNVAIAITTNKKLTKKIDIGLKN